MRCGAIFGGFPEAQNLTFSYPQQYLKFFKGSMKNFVPSDIMLKVTTVGKDPLKAIEKREVSVWFALKVGPSSDR